MGHAFRSIKEHAAHLKSHREAKIDSRYLAGVAIASTYVGSTFLLGRYLEQRVFHNPAVRWVMAVGMGAVPAYCLLKIETQR